MTIDPKMWKREELEKHSVDMSQFIDFSQSTLPNGMRIIEAYNGSGLTFTILPDRGMDIWSAHYKGIPLTWLSQGSPHPPDFGQNWLQQFNGGLLTTCGLTHVGPPETDEVTGEVRDIHGRYSRLQAHDIRVDEMKYTHLPDETIGERYELLLHGTIYETSLFGTQLKLKRTIWQSLAQPDIGIADTITNMGDKPVSFMLLYHFNLGFPLIQSGTKLFTPNVAVYPRDDAAKAGFKTWATYEEASAGYPEQVFFHHLRTNKTTGKGKTYSSKVLVANKDEDFGLLLKWQADSLPYFTQWKNTRQGMYVSGIEPGNCIPEGQNAARRNERLVMLEPGQVVETYLSLEVLDGAEQMQTYKEMILRMQQEKTIATNAKLKDYAK
jgi:hypothetical protein